MSGPRTSKLVLAAACVACLAGCSHTSTVGASRTLDIAVNEYRLNPQDIHAVSGEVILVVRNDGRLTHNLAVSTQDQTIAFTNPIKPGQAAELAVDLAPGRYSIASTMFSDQSLGVYGTLTVGG